MLLISRDDASMKIGFSVDKAHLAYIREPVFLMFFFKLCKIIFKKIDFLVSFSFCFAF